MKRTTAAVLALLTALLGAIAFAGLRYYQLWRCTDEAGLLIPGSPVVWCFAALGVIVILALVLLLVRLEKQPGTDLCFRGSMIWNLLSAAAGAALMCACALYSLKTPLNDTLRIILYTVGVAASALLVISDGLHMWGKKSHLLLYLIPTLFLAGKLIIDFKQWSCDPNVIDFCFKLLASVTGLLACFNLSGFPIGLGKRRATMFFCLLAFIFCSMTVSDYLLGVSCSTRELIFFAALGVWCLMQALQLLFPAGDATPESEVLPEETHEQ